MQKGVALYEVVRMGGVATQLLAFDMLHGGV